MRPCEGSTALGCRSPRRRSGSPTTSWDERSTTRRPEARSVSPSAGTNMSRGTSSTRTPSSSRLASSSTSVRRGLLLVRLVRAGRPVERSGDAGARVEREIVEVLGQRKLFQKPLAGLMHACIFWGFLVLLTTIVEAIGQLVDERFAIPVIGRSAWLGLVQDVFAGLVLVGLAIAVYIRKVQ